MTIHLMMAILIMGIQISMNGFMTNCFYGKVTHVFAMAHQTETSRELTQTPQQNRTTQEEKQRNESRQAKKQRRSKKNRKESTRPLIAL